MLYPIKNNKFLYWELSIKAFDLLILWKKKDCRKNDSLFSSILLQCYVFIQPDDNHSLTYFTYSMLMESKLSLNASVHAPPAVCV